MLKAFNFLLLILGISGFSNLLLDQEMDLEEAEGGDLIHVSKDGTSLYGEFISVEDLHRHNIEKGAAIFVTSWDDILMKVAGGKVYLRASYLVSKGQLLVVHPAYEEDAVVAVSPETAIELLQDLQILKEGRGSQEYFHMDRRLATRLAYPGDCTQTPHPSESPHPTGPEENADCHGEAGQLGFCDGKKGNVQWEITCVGITIQRCSAWITCVDGKFGVDSEGESIRGMNVATNTDTIFVGHLDEPGDKAYWTLRTGVGTYTEVLDCTR